MAPPVVIVRTRRRFDVQLVHQRLQRFFGDDPVALQAEQRAPLGAGKLAARSLQLDEPGLSHARIA